MDNITSYRAILAALAEVDTPEGNFAYVILGAGLTACNVLIFAAIMTHRALRNHKVTKSVPLTQLYVATLLRPRGKLLLKSSAMS